jgi:hypothetical protein
MKIERKPFKIITQLGWKACEGSVGYDYPFFVYRQADNHRVDGWCLSHMASGYSIRSQLTLKQARAAALALKKFPVFLLPDGESIMKAKKRMSSAEIGKINKILNGE